MTGAVTPARLGFLLFDGFPMACLTSAIEPLRAANEIAGRQEFTWTLLAEEAAPVRSSAEVRFDPDSALSEAPDLDYLICSRRPMRGSRTRAGAMPRCAGWTARAWCWGRFRGASSRWRARG